MLKEVLSHGRQIFGIVFGRDEIRFLISIRDCLALEQLFCVDFRLPERYHDGTLLRAVPLGNTTQRDRLFKGGLS
jgi:hypothetical protein